MGECLKTHSKTQRKSADLVSNKLRIGVFQRYQMKCKSVSKKSPRYIQLTNPTPYYINLIQLSVNGKALSNAGVVPPKSQRQTSWCQAIAPCHVAWRAINDYGGLSAKKEQNLP
ncbi:hypothetical protein AAIA46_002266 [Escherichia coli]|nr:hypothetical protein [Escherichia coli]